MSDTPHVPAPRTVEQAIAEATAARQESGRLTDLERVLRIPRSTIDPGIVVGVMTGRFSRPGAKPLRPGQAIALWECAIAPPQHGVAASLPVGEGKTLVAMLAAEAFALGSGGRPERPIVLVPAPLVKQWSAMVEEAREWGYNFTPPRCLSYGKLQTPDGEAAFRALAPDLIIFDEAHMLANLSSARTRRVVRWFVDYPDTRALVMSGTMGSSTIRQFAHLLELALRQGAPMPLDVHTLEQWAACLDPKGEAAWDDWLALWPLVRRFGHIDHGPLDLMHSDHRRRIARGAFARRLASTPGYVSVKGTRVGASLRMKVLRPTVAPSIAAALKTLSDTWTTPDGEMLVDALEFDRHASSLSVGFYRRLVWPRCTACKGSGRTKAPASWTSPDGYIGVDYAGMPCDPCDGRGSVVDDEWVEARRSWNAAVRNVLEWRAGPGFDSPALVERACREGRASDRLLVPFEEWERVRGRPAPPSEVVWLEGARTWLQETAASWCRSRSAKAGILWWASPAVGEALAEIEGVSGPFGAGSDAPTAPFTPTSTGVRGEVDPGFSGHRFPCVSRRVHGTGWNAQAWSENFVVEVPSSGEACEQLCGRTHRPGQLAGCVRVDWLGPTWRARKALETAIARSTFVVESRGEDQKLVTAQWED